MSTPGQRIRGAPALLRRYHAPVQDGGSLVIPLRFTHHPDYCKGRVPNGG